MRKTLDFQKAMKNLRILIAECFLKLKKKLKKLAALLCEEMKK